MFVDQSQESLGHIGFHVFTVGWVEPNDVTLALCVMTLVTFVVLIKIGIALYELRLRASSYTGKLLLKDFSLEDNEDKRMLIDFGICLMTLGGWFDLASTYNESLFGLR